MLAGCGAHAYVRPQGPYTGSTPQQAAEHRRNAYVTVWRHNVPQERPTAVGPCRLLHQRPWVAYTCPLRIQTGRGLCLDPLVLAVKRNGELGLYTAQVERDLLPNC